MFSYLTVLYSCGETVLGRGLFRHQTSCRRAMSSCSWDLESELSAFIASRYYFQLSEALLCGIRGSAVLAMASNFIAKRDESRKFHVHTSSLFTHSTMYLGFILKIRSLFTYHSADTFLILPSIAYSLPHLAILHQRLIHDAWSIPL